MGTYICDDGNCEIEIEAASKRAAAQEYVDDGDWGEITETMWIAVTVTDWEDDGDDGETITIAIDPDEPECEDPWQDHDWRSPIDLVGGIESNPGVWGHGGGVVITEVCILCGCKRIRDTWARNRETGEQGLESVHYEQYAYTDDELAPYR